jgi:hypothetical protein
MWAEKEVCEYLGADGSRASGVFLPIFFISLSSICLVLNKILLSTLFVVK